MKRTNSYVLGRQREYNLMTLLRGKGFFCIRGAGSKAGRVKTITGGVKHPIDIVAIKDGQAFFIQASKYYSSIDKYEKKYLKRLAFQYRARPLLAWIHEKPSVKNSPRGRWNFKDLGLHRKLKVGELGK